MPPGDVHGLIGFQSPTFLIRKNGKYYLTIGVIEYDPAAASTEAEKTDVGRVKDSFDAATASTAALVEVTMGDFVQLAQTGPRPKANFTYQQGFIVPGSG